MDNVIDLKGCEDADEAFELSQMIDDCIEDADAEPKITIPALIKSLTYQCLSCDNPNGAMRRARKDIKVEFKRAQKILDGLE
jgi:hypothetical protein